MQVQKEQEEQGEEEQEEQREEEQEEQGEQQAERLGGGSQPGLPPPCRDPGCQGQSESS